MTEEQAKNYKVSREGWPPGPWDDEPDRIDFIHVGLACLCLRNDMGNWCGYVGVPEGHPILTDYYCGPDPDVHGGITYQQRCEGDICHVPQSGMPDEVIWLGFDCAHDGDIVPGHLRFRASLSPSDEYRALDYAEKQTKALAEQISRIGALGRIDEAK